MEAQIKSVLNCLRGSRWFVGSKVGSSVGVAQTGVGIGSLSERMFVHSSRTRVTKSSSFWRFNGEHGMSATYVFIVWKNASVGDVLLALDVASTKVSECDDEVIP